MKFIASVVLSLAFVSVGFAQAPGPCSGGSNGGGTGCKAPAQPSIINADVRWLVNVISLFL